MSLLDNLGIGFGVALQLHHLVLLAVGCVLGVFAGALPWLGMLAMLALLLPVMHQLAIPAALMLALGIYCGAQAGGAGVVVDAIGSGLPLVSRHTRRRAAGALALQVLVGGLFGVAVLVVAAPLMIEQAFRFGPAEYFSLIVLGLVASLVLASGSWIKAGATLVLGGMLSQIGIDPASGAARFTFGLNELGPGLGLIPMAIGVAVVARFTALAKAFPDDPQPTADVSSGVSDFALRRVWPPLLRGAALGSLSGMLPGGGVRLGGALAAAAEESILHRAGSALAHPAADVGPATAAIVAGARSSLVPLLAWGFPVNAALALLGGLLLSKQVVVGPQLMTGRPDLFWSTIVAAGLCSVLLAVAGGWLARLASMVSGLLPVWLPALLLIFCCVGTYTVRWSAFDVLTMAVFAVLGHWLVKCGCRTGPFIVGFVLGPTLESNLRHALELSQGHWGVLITRPISAGLLLAAAALLGAVLLPSLRARRSHLFEPHD